MILFGNGRKSLEFKQDEFFGQYSVWDDTQDVSDSRGQDSI